MKIKKINIPGGNVTFAGKVDTIVFNQNLGITKEQFSELIAGIKGLAEDKQRVIENYFQEMVKAKTEQEKESITERIKAFLIKNAIPVTHSLTATAIFELAKMFA